MPKYHYMNIRHLMKKYLLLLFTLFVLFVGYSVANIWLDDDYLRVTKQSSNTFIAGTVVRLQVPDVVGGDGVDRSFEVRVPEEYKKDKPLPLLVWFSPGGGSDRVGAVPAIVDFHKFLVVAIPYPGNKLPRLAIKAGEKQINAFWEYEKPMLEYLQDSFPNISQRVRIAAGFSSGAHLIGSGIDMDWQGFTDFFTTFILHEGGYAPKMHFEGIHEDHNILLSYGTKPGYRSYGAVVAREMKRYGLHPSIIKLPHTTHAMTQESIDAIQEWIIQTLPLYNHNKKYER